jgi:hypothetical protein
MDRTRLRPVALLTARKQIDFLKEWIDERVEDIVSGRVEHPEKPILLPEERRQRRAFQRSASGATRSLVSCLG